MKKYKNKFNKLKTKHFFLKLTIVSKKNNDYKNLTEMERRVK